MGKSVELLAPAGSFLHVKAAVANGADAVYFGAGDFNARQSATNFSSEEIALAVQYCHQRGVKVYGTLNTLVTDREMAKALKVAEDFYLAGADALILQDEGLASLVKKAMPQIKLHASTQMTVHTLEDTVRLKEKGFSRVVLARELPLEDIEFIAKNAPLETEIFVHGALCMCVSGQCYMSAVIGQRSGNRGKCAQPCRLPYFIDGKQGYALSLKDLFLGDEMERIKNAGVTSLKIEGRMKRPEYVALAVKAYKNAINGEKISQNEKEVLSSIFSRSGFTDGYFTNKTGKNMFGIRSGEDKEKTDKTLSKMNLHFESKEIYAEEKINREIHHINIDVKRFGYGKPPLLEARFYRLEQVTDKTLSKIWLPINEIIENKEKIKAFIKKGVVVGAELPRFLLTANKDEFLKNVEQIKAMGIREVLCGNYGILSLAKEKGFIVNGDFGLNIFNSFSINEAEEQGLHSATLSFELSFPQIRDMNKAINCGIIGYGYLPLMIFRNCIIKNADKCDKCGGEFSLKDRKGERFTILKEFGCFNTLLNSKPLYLADKEETKKIGLSFIRLYFTTESQKYCENIIGHYLESVPAKNEFTRGLYGRGVQ